MTAHYAVHDFALSLVLPGSWAGIPLHPAEDRNRAIAALVTRQVGRADRLATIRREMREQLGDVARAAEAAGIGTLALWLELAPGIPSPGSLTIDNLAPVPAAVPPAERAAALAAQLPGADILELGPGLTARASAPSVLRNGTSPIPGISISYLLFNPEGDTLLRFHLEIPEAAAPELYVQFFDVVIDSVRWLVPAESTPADEVSGEGAPR